MDIDVDLQLGPGRRPGNGAAAGLIVVAPRRRQPGRPGGRRVRASDVLLAVEILSPGSRRLDHG